jgi:hypothetical protein
VHSDSASCATTAGFGVDVGVFVLVGVFVGVFVRIGVFVGVLVRVFVAVGGIGVFVGTGVFVAAATDTVGWLLILVRVPADVSFTFVVNVDVPAEPGAVAFAYVMSNACVLLSQLPVGVGMLTVIVLPLALIVRAVPVQPTLVTDTKPGDAPLAVCGAVQFGATSTVTCEPDSRTFPLPFPVV